MRRFELAIAVIERYKLSYSDKLIEALTRKGSTWLNAKVTAFDTFKHESIALEDFVRESVPTPNTARYLKEVNALFDSLK